MSVLWIMDTNMGEHSDVSTYVEMVRATGTRVVEVQPRPMSDDLPGPDHAGPTVLYGSVSYVQRASASGRWKPGVFAEPDCFTYAQWAQHYDEMLLNDPSSVEITTPRAFLHTTRAPDEIIFARPTRDDKDFSGTVQTVAAFQTLCHLAVQGVGGTQSFSPDLPILIGTPYGIEGEWRLFVVDGSVRGASQYRKKGRLHLQQGAPDLILDFAQDVLRQWTPAPVYVLDLCLSNGRPYIMEAQSFNSAGHYHADMRPVVEAINRVAIRA